MRRVVVFDLGNVIADWDPRYLYTKIFPDAEKIEFFLTKVCTMSWLNLVNEGASTTEAVRAKQAEFPEYATEIAAYFERWAEMIAGPVPGVPALVEALDDRGIPLYLFTNHPAETWRQTLLSLPVLRRFDGYYISGNEGIIKPAPAVYQAFVDRFQVDPRQLFFVDDDPDNVCVAVTLGWDAVVFESAGQLADALRSRGLR